MNTDAARTLNDCWNRVGVRGDRSCPELQTHIHCRNCSVYASAARALLDAPAPDEAIAAATRLVAQAHDPDRHGSLSADARSVMVFRLQTEWFAVSTGMCREVADLRPIHSLPHRRNAAVLGVANVRGGLLVCLSLPALLGVQAVAAARQEKREVTRRLLVMEHAAGAVGFPVDEIHGVERFRPGDLKEIPATLAKAQSRYSTALLPLTDKTAGVIDEQALFRAVEHSLA